MDSDYPYCMLTESCWPCPAPGYNASICGPAQPYCKKSDSCHFDPSKAAVQIASWASLSSDEETLKAQLYQNGPVSIAIDATALYVYWGGVIQGHLCSSDKGNMDHAVLLVGYGSEKNMWGKRRPIGWSRILGARIGERKVTSSLQEEAMCAELQTIQPRASWQALPKT